MARNKKAGQSSQPEASDLRTKAGQAPTPTQSNVRVTRSMDEVTGIPPLAPSSVSGMVNAPPAPVSFASVVRDTTDNLDLPSSPVRGGNIKVSRSDVADEVEFWKTSVVCHILGGNPPLNVFQAFVQKIWKSDDVQKVAMLAKGFYLIKFANMDARNRALEGGMSTFDRKPVVLTPWTPKFNVTKVDEQIVPVWVRVPGLPIQYWGKSVLSMISSQLGKPLRVDNATANRDRLHFARILIDMDIRKAFPDEITFQNEEDELVSFKVEYEWKPIRCSKCMMFGHVADQCKLEERMALKCDYCNLQGHTKDKCNRKGKAPVNDAGKVTEKRQNTNVNVESRKEPSRTFVPTQKVASDQATSGPGEPGLQQPESSIQATDSADLDGNGNPSGARKAGSDGVMDDGRSLQPLIING